MNPLPSLTIPALLMAMCLTISNANANPAIEPKQGPYPNRHASILKAVAATPKSQLVFIGDSITHQWGGNPSATPDGLQDLGTKTWEKHYAPFQALNMGVGGDKTENILWRLQNGALDGISPKVFVVLAGTNNCKVDGTPPSTPEQTAEGILAISTTLRQTCPKAEVILLGILPRNHAIDSPETRAFPTEVNRVLAVKIKNLPHVTYLDFSAEFSDEKGAPRAKFFYDGLHLNTDGYEEWERQMRPTLKTLLSK